MWFEFERIVKFENLHLTLGKTRLQLVAENGQHVLRNCKNRRFLLLPVLGLEGWPIA